MSGCALTVRYKGVDVILARTCILAHTVGSYRRATCASVKLQEHTSFPPLFCESSFTRSDQPKPAVSPRRFTGPWTFAVSVMSLAPGRWLDLRGRMRSTGATCTAATKHTFPQDIRNSPGVSITRSARSPAAPSRSRRGEFFCLAATYCSGFRQRIGNLGCSPTTERLSIQHASKRVFSKRVFPSQVSGKRRSSTSRPKLEIPSQNGRIRVLEEDPDEYGYVR